MKTFYCNVCDNLLFFENVKCIHCGHGLGFLPDRGELSAFEPAEDGTWRSLGPDQTEPFYRLCGNSAQHQVCNWMIPAADPNPFCVSCRLNMLIPDLSRPLNMELWHKFEIAKRRVIYTIMRLGLPMEETPGEGRPALRFSFIGDVDGGLEPLTGHVSGLVVVNIAEADDAELERRRVYLREPYRTLLGHLRHEIAHYYWDRLIAFSQWLPKFRELFGDETSSYEEALSRYYQLGAPPDWAVRHVSAYSSAHPWEDWAESWAHYFHIMDMVETAESFGMILNPKGPAAPLMAAHPRNGFDFEVSFDEILDNWLPLTFALNSLNRGMGCHDLYPFALSSRAMEKLRFIHEVVKKNNAIHKT